MSGDCSVEELTSAVIHVISHILLMIGELDLVFE